MDCQPVQQALQEYLSRLPQVDPGKLEARGSRRTAALMRLLCVLLTTLESVAAELSSQGVALEGRAPLSHTHPASEIPDLAGVLAGYQSRIVVQPAPASVSVGPSAVATPGSPNPATNALVVATASLVAVINALAGRLTASEERDNAMAARLAAVERYCSDDRAKLMAASIYR